MVFLIEQVTKNNFIMAHKTITHWKGRMLFESDNPSGNTVLMDTTGDGVARQQGLSPKAMMLSSLAGCSGIDIVDILKKMKITKNLNRFIWVPSYWRCKVAFLF